MTLDRDVRISQCMIVKDEEENIRRALSWGKNVMWEQIVVDTGSTDKTVDIARELGAKVFCFPWVNDFAAAKNYAIEQAEGDWIALLDADEYIVEGEIKKLVKAVQEAHRKGMDGLSTGWQQIDDEGQIFSSGTQVRFFRNSQDIRYRRRIHEQLESVSGKELRLGDFVAELSIFHTGYQRKAMEEKQLSQRNLSLILEELNDHPDDYEMMGYMGDEYLNGGDRKEAEKWYRRSVNHMPSELPEYDQRSAVTFTRLLSILLETEGSFWKDGQEIYEKGIKLFPKEADLDYIAGYYWAREGEFTRAVQYLEAAFQKLDTFGCNNKALLLAGNIGEAYELMVQCCYESGDWEKCVSYGVNYLKYNKYGMAVLSRLMKALCSDEEKNRQIVLGFLSKIYDVSSLKDRIFLVKAAQKAGCGKFADYVADCFFSPEERKQLGL